MKAASRGIEAIPCDDEPARGIHRGRRMALGGGGDAVHLELRSLRRAGGVVALRVDARARPVLTLALPDDEESARGIHGHGGTGLVARAVCVDLELITRGLPCRIEAPCEYPVAAAVLAVAHPDDQEVAPGVHC